MVALAASFETPDIPWALYYNTAPDCQVHAGKQVLVSCESEHVALANLDDFEGVVSE